MTTVQPKNKQQLIALRQNEEKYQLKAHDRYGEMALFGTKSYS
ncbi:MAG TPA: hypothetical protein VGE97_08555 [Nitrososphaera sp.]|jgi:hypothetical protein